MLGVQPTNEWTEAFASNMSGVVTIYMLMGMATHQTSYPPNIPK